MLQILGRAGPIPERAKVFGCFLGKRRSPDTGGRILPEAEAGTGAVSSSVSC